ncbi:hypothetical protein [Microbacterium sp.]|uniref:hypothetical protein n=1 Tax=Microbacterium sp. TaxID=51671 RepID=UPI0031FE7FE0|nr:hypothetical protein [Microbacterium sp.]
MGKLSGRNYEVTKITYTINAHASGAHFTVPKAVAEELGAGDDRWIGLAVRRNGAVVFDDDALLFDDDLRLASGTEAYYRVSDEHAAGLKKIEPHDSLEVTARRTSQRERRPR